MCIVPVRIYDFLKSGRKTIQRPTSYFSTWSIFLLHIFELTAFDPQKSAMDANNCSSEVKIERHGRKVAKEGARSQANSTAISRVLGNYELLENILGCLDFEDLMQAQQVSTDFYDVTNRSKMLRENLFLEGGDGARPPNQDGHPFHPDFFSPFHEFPVETVHPLLQPEELKARERYLKSAPVEWHFSNDFERVQHLLRNRGQSWEKMHITQPPTVLVSIDVYQHMASDRGGSDVWYDRFEVRNTAGIRLGEVVDGIYAKLNSERRKQAEEQEELYGLRGKAGLGMYMRSELDLTWFDAEYRRSGRIE